MAISREQKIERIQKAFELRKAGKTLRQIADILGYSHEMVRKDIQSVIQTIVAETRDNAQHLVSMELARLDDMQFSLWADARKGDKKAIDTVLRIMERRAKLLGLDINRNVTITVTPEEISKMTDEELNELIHSTSKGSSSS